MSWPDDAACVDEPLSTFYPQRAKGPGGLHRSSRLEARAKVICGACPVSARCLDYAMRIEHADTHRYGIWGGLNPDERRRLARRAS